MTVDISYNNVSLMGRNYFLLQTHYNEYSALSQDTMITTRGYFYNDEKGDVAELRQQLQSSGLEKRTIAAEKALKQLLKGNNVEALFPDMLKCAHTDCFKLKKTVYMFLSLTAEKQPELAMLAANTLTHDLSSHLPIIRALALRTIVRMDIQSLTLHLALPLYQSLSDEDPYVRKTAVLCVAKLARSQKSLLDEFDYVDRLKDMVLEANVAVLVNVIAALMETGKLELSQFSVVLTLLTALNEANEWGKVVILQAVMQYQTGLFQEIETIWAKVIPYLAHANAAVILTTVRVLLPLIDHFPTDHESSKMFKPRFSSALKTLLSAQPEIQYVTLRSIPIVLGKYPDLFQNDCRSFFIKYNDPIYVKMEKLEVMVRLADRESMLAVISEFEEYAKEADVDLARNAVRAISRCAIRVEETSGICVNALLGLLETGVDHILESNIVAFRDIFRRYPGRYEHVLKSLSEHIETLESTEARDAFIWMLGEYNKHIYNADELLESFAQNFSELDNTTQLTILTAVVKLFLNQPDTSHLVRAVLEEAITLPNPDLRDRAFIYWRLLSTDPQTAKMIVLAEKPPINDHSDNLPNNILNALIKEIGNLAGVYHNLPEHFDASD